MSSPLVLYTLGHSNHSLERFLELVQSQEVEVVVDTRSQPYSRYVPHFNPRELETALTAKGVAYRFLGQELGGRPPETEFYDSEGHVRYDKVAESARFREGISQLTALCASQRVAILCSEEHPSHCHRRLLVGKVLDLEGWEIRHIRASGAVQTEQELSEAEARTRNPQGQQSLFQQEEVQAWRSTQSVLPKNPPKSFSSG